MVAPFVALLLAVALAPFWFAAWWGRNLLKVIGGLMCISLGYYLLVLHAHERVLQTAQEYISFICLIGSLFVVSGGIHIHVKGEATPRANVVFLLIGALLANILGTTGASMLLVRPWLRMNKYRLTSHHVIFFIFVVSNVGGSLTPVGDPPLFLGYLKGVPFWWVAKQCWGMWVLGIGLLLLAFYIVDSINFRRAPREIRDMETAHEVWSLRGLGNLFFLGAILVAVFVRHPIFLREAIMLSAAVASYMTTAKSVHEANDFNFSPIKEVAILFAGIFATMMPALDWLHANAAQLGTFGPSLCFWGSGALSSVLDNAPTYLSFLSASYGAFVPPDLPSTIAAYVNAHGADLTGLSGVPNATEICQAIAVFKTNCAERLANRMITPEHAQMALLLANPFYARCLQAISIGSVFFGANTYIGNGPNFMVKAIADQQKAHTPTFLGYVLRFTLPYMIPMLLIVWWVFFRS